jgi:hypothetical protein
VFGAAAGHRPIAVRTIRNGASKVATPPGWVPLFAASLGVMLAVTYVEALPIGLVRAFR